MTQDTSSKTLTEVDAAQYIGMSRSWLAQARMNDSANAPPYLKIGRSVRYLRGDLDSWLEGHRRHSSVAVPAQESR